MEFFKKFFGSRKMWVAAGGILVAYSESNATLAAIIAGVYLVAQGIVDAFGGNKTIVVEGVPEDVAEEGAPENGDA